MSLSEFASQYLVIFEENDVARVQFKDQRLTDEDNIEQIGRELFALTDQYNCQKVILDLTGLKMLTSSVLGKMNPSEFVNMIDNSDWERDCV